ncbi:MAG: MBL fold metallo-hydrolase [Phycisphaerales bacterium]|nr:MBL fold metallo-hydrolase [Phycisphaerales bacterium]
MLDTSLSRRSFIHASGLAVGAALIAGPARASLVRPRLRGADTYFEWKQVGEGVHAGFGEGGNSMVLVGKRDAMVVDAKNGGFGQTLYREANMLAGAGDLRLLINTHHHADHTGGNPAFTSRQGLAVMAHAKAKERIGGNAERALNGARAAIKTLEGSDKPAAKKVLEDVRAFIESSPKAEAFTPTRGLEIAPGQQLAMPIADQTVNLIHNGPGHTDNDLIVFIPKLNIVHSGDLVFNRMWPYVDRPGGATIEGWIASLKKLLSLSDGRTVVIPGHGDVTDKKGVQAQIDFFLKIRELAEKAVKDGQSKEDFQKLTPEEYKDYAAGDWIRPITLGGVWEEVKGVPVETK